MLHFVELGRLMRDRVIRYEWGPRTPMDVLHKMEIFVPKGSSRRKVSESTKSYTREEIWKHTTAPDAKVLG